MTKNSNWRPVALSVTALGAIIRLAPHPPNFAPVGATSLFAGARLPVWQAYLVPLALMAITDPILARFYGVPAFSKGTLFIYASFLISVWLGRRLRDSKNVLKIGAVSLLNSMQFFVISDLGVWALSKTYPRTITGLADCYVAAIPFFGYTVLSDLLYTAVLFGLYAVLSRTLAAQERVASAA